MLQKIWAAYFSPTGGVRRAALGLAEKLGAQVEEIDLSAQEKRGCEFGSGDVVLIAAPVYGGRIPARALEQMEALAGDGAEAVTVAVYGNRAFDDALLELNDYIKERGFHITASAAMIAEHSMSRAVAAGRPDQRDLSQAAEFAEKILQKLESGETGREGKAGSDGKQDVTVPGNRPYVDWKPMPVTPLVSEACTKCGSCADKCPTQAIPVKDPGTTDAAKCMLCMRCVEVCPVGARALPEQVAGMLAQKLGPLEGVRRENELFL